jgi:hypothetical protein
MQIINVIFSFILFSESVLSIPRKNGVSEAARIKLEKRNPQQPTCPVAACPLYALNSYIKKSPCSGGCILEYNLRGSIATCNSAFSKRLTSKPIKC